MVRQKSTGLGSAGWCSDLIKCDGTHGEMIMLGLLEFFLLFTIFIGIGFWGPSFWIWLSLGIITLLSFTFFSTINFFFLGFCWVTLLAVGAFFAVPTLRQQWLSKPLLKFFQKTLPPMSQTEREAIDAGDTWWEGELFRGRPNWKKMLKAKPPALSEAEQSFLDHQVDTLCGMINHWQINHDELDLPKDVWDYLKKEGFFGLEIPKKYGGLEFSKYAHSTVIVKLAGREPSVAISAMVPNSLGPAELILNYGTEEQKDHYLPRLAHGEEIPCFALTSPHAGSDAGSIRDEGVVCMGEYKGKQTLGIRLSWDKRYITLAPIATLIGLAFKLYDPDHLIGDKEFLGITLALVPADHPGVETGKRHCPMNLAFMNGPIRGKDVFIPLDWIIGGTSMVGQGWRMLVESLSVGRAISLPSLSAANGRVCYRMTGAYAKVREQFNVSIGEFEGVQEAMAKIAGMHYIIEATRIFTASAIDQGISPAIASAIAKYHTTELSRTLLNHAMDVHGGRTVQNGPRNYLESLYLGQPISITVEGANILTRNLIIFGQGAIRCHPFIEKEMMAVTIANKKERLKVFDKLIFQHIGYTTSNVVRAIVLGLTRGMVMPVPAKRPIARYYREITRLSTVLAVVSDMAMLTLGGSLKRRERLSARLGDVLSNLYLCSAVLKYYSDHNQQADDLPHVLWGLQFCLYRTNVAFNEFFRNFPVRWLANLLKFSMFPYGLSFKAPSDKLEAEMANMMMTNSNFKERITNNFYKGKDTEDAIGRMEYALDKAIQVAPLKKKLKQAIKQGVISKNHDLEAMWQHAIDTGTLTIDEVNMLREYEAIHFDAIAVDEFTSEELTKGLSRRLDQGIDLSR